MRATFSDLFLLNFVNGSSIAVLTLNDVKDGVAIVLGIVSIISTLLIIRDSFRKRRDGKSEVRTATSEMDKREEFRPRIRLFVLLTVAAFLTGCEHLDSLYNREVSAVPGEVIKTNATYRTNIVVLEAAKTNEAGIVTAAKIAYAVTPEIVVRHAEPTYVTNLVPRTGVETGIRAAGAMPIPWAGTVALGIGWLYSAYASLRNKQVAKALVQSVQVGREFLQSTAEGQKLDSELGLAASAGVCGSGNGGEATSRLLRAEAVIRLFSFDE